MKLNITNMSAFYRYMSYVSAIFQRSTPWTLDSLTSERYGSTGRKAGSQWYKDCSNSEKKPTATTAYRLLHLTTHSTHFIYGYMAEDHSDRKETRCRHMGYSFQLTARVLLYASSHRQDNTYHGLCYTSRGALAGRRNS